MTLANPLHKYTSYNYRWKFGVIGPQNIHQPETYRQNGPDLTIIQSGGFPDKSVTTFAEQALGVNVEYYIDNVNSEYLVVPNPGTSNANNIQIEFKVYEPLSVGLFFQTIRLATDQLYNNQRGYLDVPFCLQCDFVGFDDDGNTHQEPPHTLALKLINVTFNVDQSGSVYTVTAIPWNHQAFTDEISKVQTDITLAGETVYSMLAGETETSLVYELNRQQEDLEASNSVVSGNRYIIEFPIDPSFGAGTTPPNLNTNIINPNSSSEVPEFRSTADLQAQRERNRQPITTGFGAGQVDPALAGAVASLPGQRTNDQRVAVRTEQASLASGGNVNYIGQSAIVSNFDDFGNNPFGIEPFVFDEGDDQVQGDEVFTRGTLSIDATAREFTFEQGTKIERMISMIILSSEWGLNLINQVPDSDGNVSWFKIHSETRIRNLAEIGNSGIPSYEFIYRVTPYKIDASRIAPAWSDQNYQPKIAQALKTYQYTYTGLNSDIINFEFNIDNSFYKELARRSTQTRDDTMHNSGGGVSTVSQTNQAVPNTGNNSGSNLSDAGTTSRITGVGNESPGTGANTAARDVANTFNRAILNSDVDNVVLDLKIWGDPYYFMDSDCGNIITPSGGNPNITNDGKIDPSRNEVYVLIQFRTGVDYNGNLVQIDPGNAFSGIYRVITFQNNFDNGMFTQTLNLARMPNQTNSSVEASNSVVEANLSGNLPLVIGNLTTEAANRTLEFQQMLRQAEELERIATAFSQKGITEFADILGGQQIQQLAQGLFGAFSQVKNIQATLNNTLGLLNGGIEGIARAAVSDAINKSPIGGVVKNVNNIKSGIENITHDLSNIGRRR